MSLDLAVLIPVYNEEACVVRVVKSWQAVLSCLQIKFRIIILNDGSTDGTRETLEAFKGDSHVVVIHKENSGHGPTILLGYQKAVETAQWVFQCDGDDEIKPDYFPYLWHKRKDFDVLFGVRQGRDQNVSRWCISIFSRLSVRILFGRGVTDVNVPYRLMRSSILNPIIVQIPSHIFAPNVIISGVLSRERVRIYEYPVLHEGRKTGEVSIVKWKLFRVAIKSFWQVLWCRPKLGLKHGM